MCTYHAHHHVYLKRYGSVLIINNCKTTTKWTAAELKRLKFSTFLQLGEYEWVEEEEEKETEDNFGVVVRKEEMDKMVNISEAN